jgi:molybdopterin molybdotransferase
LVSSAVKWCKARSVAHAAGAAVPARTETVPLAGAAGRALAEPLVAKVSLPGFDTAAMDGYAVAGPGPWRLAGRVLAGDRGTTSLRPGEAVEVATGAAVPAGAAAVVAYELGQAGAGVLEAAAVHRGQHIRRVGEEVEAGTEIIAAGRVITPAVVSLAAAVGYDELPVRAVPRVAAVITGDELLDTGVPSDTLVRDAIGPALTAMLAWSGAETAGVSRVRDSAADLLAVIGAAEADVLIVSGSSSAGLADHLEKCLHDLGAEPLVTSVLCTPGRTQSLWRLADGRLLVGLPGNPLAAIVAYLTLVEPICRGLLGLDLDVLDEVACPVSPHQTRTRLVPVTLAPNGAGAAPCDFAGSGMLRGVAAADCLAVIEPGSNGTAELLPLPGGRR